jgi:hypothetical protein
MLGHSRHQTVPLGLPERDEGGALIQREPRAAGAAREAGGVQVALSVRVYV